MHLHSITPTRVALIELVTLGLGSKRGDETKIGHKGSGMKFAIAALHRHGSRSPMPFGSGLLIT